MATDDLPPSRHTLPSTAWKLDAGEVSLVSPKGQHVPLTPAEFAVLGLLLATPGHQVSRDTLIAAVADDADAFDPHRLEMLIHRLRNKVLDTCGERPILRAVRGEGYVLLP